MSAKRKAVEQVQGLPDDDDLLGTEELAAWLRTTPGGIHTRRSRGGDLPPAIRTSPRGPLLWRKGDVRAWLKAKTEAA